MEDLLWRLRNLTFNQWTPAQAPTNTQKTISVERMATKRAASSPMVLDTSNPTIESDQLFQEIEEYQKATLSQPLNMNPPGQLDTIPMTMPTDIENPGMGGSGMGMLNPPRPKAPRMCWTETKGTEGANNSYGLTEFSRDPFWGQLAQDNEDHNRTSVLPAAFTEPRMVWRIPPSSTSVAPSSSVALASRIEPVTERRIVDSGLLSTMPLEMRKKVFNKARTSLAKWDPNYLPILQQGLELYQQRGQLLTIQLHGYLKLIGYRHLDNPTSALAIAPIPVEASLGLRHVIAEFNEEERRKKWLHFHHSIKMNLSRLVRGNLMPLSFENIMAVLPVDHRLSLAVIFENRTGEGGAEVTLAKCGDDVPDDVSEKILNSMILLATNPVLKVKRNVSKGCKLTTLRFPGPHPLLKSLAFLDLMTMRRDPLVLNKISSEEIHHLILEEISCFTLLKQPTDAFSLSRAFFRPSTGGMF